MNCFLKQRLLSLLMTGSLMLGMSPSVLALDGYNGVKDIPGVGNSEVTLTVENTGGGGGGDTPIDPDNPDVPPVDPTIFSAYVPAELPIKMDLDGNIIVPDNAMIINAVETRGICVTDIGVTLESGWSASNWEDDFSAKKENSKELGLKLRSDYLNSDGSFSLSVDDWKIPKNSFIDLNMGAKLPKQTEVGSKGKIATISFTLDWSGDDVSVGPEIPGGNPNGGSSGGESETPEEPVGKVSVKFVSDENGSLEGETELVINSGDTVSFPAANPKSIRYELSNWVDTSTNNKVSETTPIVEDTTIKAVFDERAASPKNWFTTDGANTITGLSEEYLNLVDAPTDLVIPKTIGGSTIKVIGASAFKNKDLITTLVIPDTVIGIDEYAFEGCTNLGEILLPEGVAYIKSGAFTDCESLKLELPSGLQSRYIGMLRPDTSSDDYSGRTVNQDTFRNVKELHVGSNLIEQNYDTSSGTSGRTPFVNIQKIVIKDGTKKIGNYALYVKEIFVPNSVKNIPSHDYLLRYDKLMIDAIEGTLWDAPLSSDKVIYLREMPKYGFYVSEDGILNTYKAAKDLNGEVIIPKEIDGIRVKAIGDSCFSGLSEVTSIIIPDSITSIGNSAFSDCTGLTSLTISDSITSIGFAAFSNCTGLTSITIPDSITSIGHSAFSNCTGLTSITIPDSITSIGHSAFSNCTGLTSITIPNSVTSIGNSAFFDCTGLTSITIPNSVTSIGNNAFEMCRNLTTVSLSENLMSLNDKLFFHCWSLTNITIPDSVTSIGSQTFDSCRKLSNISIPKNVTSIGSYAFNSSNLTNLIIPDSVTSIDSTAFYRIPHITYNGTATGAPWGALSMN